MISHDTIIKFLTSKTDESGAWWQGSADDVLTEMGFVPGPFSDDSRPELARVFSRIQRSPKARHLQFAVTHTPSGVRYGVRRRSEL
jgi:hypothetical protein